MKSKTIVAITFCFLGLAFFLSRVVVAQQQSPGERAVTVTEIPGVVAAGAQWKVAWQDTTDNGDGLVGTPDGGLLFGQEQGNKVGKLDKDDHYSVYVKNTRGTGAVAMDSKGRVIGVERTCFDPGGHPDQCTEPGAVAVLAPAHKVLADSFEGKELGRTDKLVVDKKGGVYFNTEAALAANPVHRPEGTADTVFYVSGSGKVSRISENIHPSGETLSPDEKTLYATNGAVLVAFDVQPDGTARNQREFAKLEAGGTGIGMTVDAAGRVYVSSGPGIQVFSPEGKYLGLIPTPRPGASAAFSGPDKKTLYAQGRGAVGPDGKEFKTPDGVRNNAKSIYKIPMLAQGLKGRW